MSFLLFYAFLSTKFLKLSDSLIRQLDSSPTSTFSKDLKDGNIAYLSGGLTIRVFRTATNRAI